MSRVAWVYALVLKEGSKDGVPPGWRGVRRPERGGAEPCVETRA